MSWEYSGCTIEHFRRKYFAGRSERSTSSYRRVAYLVDQGFLTSTRLPPQGMAGSGRAFLTPGPAATPFLTRALGVSAAEVRRLRDGFTPIFVYHHLATCDIRLALELASQASTEIAQLEWTTETELRRTPIRVEDPLSTARPRAKIPLVADGAFVLTARSGVQQRYLLETDMSTLTRKRMEIKLRGYATHLKGLPTPVLIVTTNRLRQSALVQWATSQAARVGGDPTMFWLTQKDQIDAETILSAPIWQVAGGPSNISLLGQQADAFREEA